MVRIVSLDPALDRFGSGPATAERGDEPWSSGPLARWLERDGYALEARDCGDGSWAVLARKGAALPCVVATGLAGGAAALAWIERERRWTPRMVADAFRRRAG